MKLLPLLVICVVLMVIGSLWGAEAGKFSCSTNEEGEMICSLKFDLPPGVKNPEEYDQDGFSSFGEGAGGSCISKDKHDELEVFYPELVKGNKVKLSWEATEDDIYLYLMVGMPGLKKGDVKVTVEQQNTLVFHGQGEKERTIDAHGRTRSYRISFHLPRTLFDLYASSGYVENGAIHFVVPKLKNKASKEIHEINIY